MFNVFMFMLLGAVIEAPWWYWVTFICAGFAKFVIRFMEVGKGGGE